MLKMGIPESAVEMKMRAAGLDSAILKLGPDTLVSAISVKAEEDKPAVKPNFLSELGLKKLKKVVTQDIFTSKIAILDWLILARIAMRGNIKRCPKGLMILGSSGASNSKDLTWYTQLDGFRAKLSPYRGFLGLVTSNQHKNQTISRLEIMIWVNSLNLGHYKGLFALLFSSIKLLS